MPEWYFQVHLVIQWGLESTVSMLPGMVRAMMVGKPLNNDQVHSYDRSVFW